MVDAIAEEASEPALIPADPAEPRCRDCTSTPCTCHSRERHVRESNRIELRGDRPFGGVPYGIRWASGDIAWRGGTRAFVEKRYRDPATGKIRSPLTGELVARRVMIGEAVELPYDPIHLSGRA